MSYQAVVGMFCLLFAIAILQSHQLRFASSCESHISSFTIKLNNETHTHTLTGASLLTTKPASTSAIFYWAQSQHCDPKSVTWLSYLFPGTKGKINSQNWDILKKTLGTRMRTEKAWLAQMSSVYWESEVCQSWQELVERTSARKKQAWHEFRYFRVRLWIGVQLNNK